MRYLNEQFGERMDEEITFVIESLLRGHDGSEGGAADAALGVSQMIANARSKVKSFLVS